MDTSPSSQDKTTVVSSKTLTATKVKSRKRKLPGFVKLLIALVLIGGIAGGVLLWRAQTSASAATSTTIALAVTQGDLSVTVQSNGNVQANTEKTVTYQASGTVTDVLVKSGDKVTAGQVLIKQTDTDQKEALASAQAGLNSAQAKLDDLQKGPSEAAVNSAKADVASAQAALDALTAGSTPQDIADATADLKTAQTELTTVKAGATTKELQDAAADLKTAQTALATLKAGATSKDLQDAQADLTTAQTTYNTLKAGATDTELKNAQADLDSAQAAYDALTQPPSASDLKEAQSALDTAKATYAALKAGPTAAQLSTAKLAVTKAQASITSIQTQAALDKQTAQLTLDKANRDLAQTQRDYGAIAGDVLDEQGNITVPASNPKYDQYWTAYNAMKDAEQVQTQDLNQLNNVIQKEKNDVAAAQATLDDANTQLATVQAGATTADLMSAQHDVDSAQKTLDDLTKAPTAAELASAKAAVTKAQTALDTLKAGPTASDLATAQAAVTKAQTALDALKAGPTADDLAAAETTVTKAQTAYNELKAEPTANDLATAQAAVDKAQAALTALKSGSTPQAIAAAKATLAGKQSTLATLIEPATASDIAAAQEAVATAQSAVDTANSDLAKTVITAPFSGTIASVTAEPSGTAAIGTEALTIYDESGMQLELAVNESDIQSIKVGQDARITLDALPGAVFTGTVSTVSNVSTTSSDVVTYAVSVQFNPGTEPVKTGMSATANIVTESHSGVIQVPTRAITTQGREKIVKVLYGTDKTPVTIGVTTGLASGAMTEVTGCVDTGNQCLRAGDQVEVTVVAATTTTNGAATGTFPGGGAFPGGTFPGGGTGTFQRGTGGGNR